MAEFRRIKMSLFLMLLLHFTAAANGQPRLFLTVRDGDEVTLSCDSLPADHNNCDFTHWLFDNSRGTDAEDLVRGGKIVVQDKSKSDRLSVTENCSLVIKKVTSEDVSRYTCRQLVSGQQRGQGSFVHLSVVNMSEQKDNDEVTLNCSVSTHQQCTHTVKWLFQGQEVDKDNQRIRTSRSICSASVTFPTSHFNHTSGYNLFKCEVTDPNKVQVFPFSSPRPTATTPGNSPAAGEDTTTATTEQTVTTPGNSPAAGEDTTTATTEQTVTTPGNSPAAGWLRVVIVSVGLAALIITVVAVNIWTRTKEKKTQTDEIAVRYDADGGDGDGTVNYENIRSADRD